MGFQPTTRGPHATRGYICTLYIVNIPKISQFRQSGVPLIVIFPRAVREPFHKDCCGPLALKGWRSKLYTVTAKETETRTKN